MSAFLSGLDELVSGLDGSIGPLFSRLKEQVRHLAAGANSLMADYQASRDSDTRRRRALCAEFIPESYHPFRSGVDALFKPKISKFLAVVADAYPIPEARGPHYSLLKMHSGPTDVEEILGQLDSITPSKTAKLPAMAGEFCRVYNVYKEYLILRSDFERFLFNDFGIPTLPSQKHLMQYTGPVAATGEVALPSRGDFGQLEATRRAVEDKRRRLAELRIRRPKRASLRRLHGRERKMQRAAELLAQKELEFTQRELAIANEVNAEWMNLAKFAQEVADCAMQTVTMLSGQKNLFSRADILAAKRHIANEVDKEMDAPDPSKESLGPLLSHFDQMKKT